MYIPRLNAESRPDVLFDYMEAHPLATLVSATPEHGLIATHLPLLVNRTDGQHGTLHGHIARANPHHERARALAPDAESLVIFSGENAYITPMWYASKEEHGKVVPTWNYIAVHVYGTLRFNDDPASLRRHVERLTQVHEAHRDPSWSVSDAPTEYIDQQLRAIVGIELAITRVEGKWKMSQNRPAADIDGVVRGLGESDRAEDRAVAEIVTERRPKS